ncbi:hypothetical protein [Paenibacillus polymyxa]|uniref:hypothetical protein n=1 Tax=Paenibacillus polymyxa TaxID=1406 RepID=UPI002AB590CE|nr:hypothetical protein [Paenibacillus polymyxa]MDY8023397.1 hypothetical protein [Paenibacillus polymyxa]
MSEKFARFYNCYYRNGSYKLNPRQWYFMCLLGMREDRYYNHIETNINLISQIQSVYQDKVLTRRKSGTAKTINELIELDVLTLKNDVSITNNYDELLILEINNIDKGFNKINLDIWTMAEDIYELYFLSILTGHRKGYRKRIDDLAELIGLGTEKVRSVIVKLTDKNLIKADRNIKQTDDGKFQSSPYIFYFNYAFKESSSVPAKEDVSENEEQESIPKEGESRSHNWFEWKSRIEAYDFYVYESTHDEQLKKQAAKRIESLKKTGAWTFIQRLWDEGRSRAVRERKELEQEERETFLSTLDENKNYLERNGELIIIDDSAAIQPNDYMFIDGNNKKLVEDIIKCQTRGFRMLEDGDVIYLFSKLKELIRSKRFDLDTYKDYRLIFNELIDKRNQNLSPEQEHYGDEYESYDGKSETNISLQARKERLMLNRIKEVQYNKRINEDTDITDFI